MKNYLDFWYDIFNVACLSRVNAMNGCNNDENFNGFYCVLISYRLIGVADLEFFFLLFSLVTFNFDTSYLDQC